MNITVLTEVLEKRIFSIKQSLDDVNKKFKKTQVDLEEAKKELEISKLKAEEIKAQGLFFAEQTKEKIKNSLEQDISRLKEANLAIIKLEERKVLIEVVLYCFKLLIIFYFYFM